MGVLWHLGLLEKMKEAAEIMSSIDTAEEGPNLPDEVYFQDAIETVVIKYGDKTTTVSTHDDEYDRRFGFLLAYFQANCGLSKNKANKFLDNLMKLPAQKVRNRTEKTCCNSRAERLLRVGDEVTVKGLDRDHPVYGCVATIREIEGSRYRLQFRDRRGRYTGTIGIAEESELQRL